MRWSARIGVLACLLFAAPMALAQQGAEKPEDAIKAFAQAYEAADFAAAFALLTPEAQQAFTTTVSEDGVDKVFPDVRTLDVAVDDPLDPEQTFIAYMEAAARIDALPFSMPALDIVRPTVDEPTVAIHLMYTGGTPDILVVQTNKTKKGWRLHKISWSATDGKTLPWGIR